MDDLVPIGEFSERSGLSPKRLRSYAAAGLLLPAAVDSTSGYRYYSPGQLRDARLIDALRDAGMPLVDISALLRERTVQQLDEWATRVEVDAAQRHEALDLARRLLASEPAAVQPHGDFNRGGTTMLNAASRTDVGHVRENNEDAVVATDSLAVVADGMGGRPGGEVASAVAVSLVEAAYTGRSVDELAAAVRAANRAIWDRAGSAGDLEGMGTTICAAAVTEDGNLTVVHVGDSRAYVWRDGSLQQLTEDHSLTGDLVRRGELNEQQALEHPLRGVLTRALGAGPDVELDCATHRVTAGDRLLLCTDGLVNEVAADEIASVMAANEDVRATTDNLVELALSRGGRDNVTVVVADVCE